MGFQKVLPVGQMGQVTLSESGGVATLTVGLNASVGGGSVAGVAKASANLEVDVSAVQLVDAAFALAAAKWPSMAGLLQGAQAIVDAELAKA